MSGTVLFTGLSTKGLTGGGKRGRISSPGVPLPRRGCNHGWEEETSSFPLTFNQNEEVTLIINISQQTTVILTNLGPWHQQKSQIS